MYYLYHNMNSAFPFENQFKSLLIIIIVVETNKKKKLAFRAHRVYVT